MSTEFDRVESLKRSLKKSNSPLEETRNWYRRYVPYYYIELREHTKDESIIELLNTVGDEKIARCLDNIITGLTSSHNRRALFEVFSGDNEECNNIFAAFNKRISEGSGILNKEQYKVLANAYNKFQDIEKERNETEKEYEEEVRKLVNAYSNNQSSTS